MSLKQGLRVKCGKLVKIILFSLIGLILFGHLINETIYVFKYPKRQEKVTQPHSQFKLQNDVRIKQEKIVNKIEITSKTSSSYSFNQTQPEVKEGMLSKECELVLYGTYEDIQNQRKKDEKQLNLNDQPMPWSDKTNDEEVIRRAEDCTSLKRRYGFIVGNVNSTKTELNTPIAYSILVHQDSNQLTTLLAAMYRQQNIHCIHVDAKASKEFKEAVNAVASCFPNVFLSTKSQDIVYASIERLLADINCIQDLLRIPSSIYNWKYLINLCGQDFPLLTNREIVAQLQELKGRNFIHGDINPSESILQRTLFKFRIVTSEDNFTKTVQKTNIPHEPPPFNLTVSKNLAYNILSRNFLQWAFVDGHVGQKLIEWSYDTYSPDEHFWMMLNSHPDAPDSSLPYKLHIARKIIWNKINRTCHGYYRHNVCVFASEDMKGLIAPNTLQMFANKFDMSHDSVTVDCMKQWTDERAMLPPEKRTRNSDKNPKKLWIK